MKSENKILYLVVSLLVGFVMLLAQSQLGIVEKRFDRTDTRLDRIEQKIDNIEAYWQRRTQEP